MFTEEQSQSTQNISEKKPRAQHSNESCEWYTPQSLIACVQNVFGGAPDFDPASSEEANKLVGAKSFLTKEDDALSEKDWPTNDKSKIFMNPPSGRKGKDPLPRLFWQNLLTQEWQEAIIIVYSLEQLQNNPIILRFSSALCIPFQRIKYVQPLDPFGANKPPMAPTHASAIAFLCRGNSAFCDERSVVFRDEFAHIGHTFSMIK
jgi:hypothetical protein